MCLHNGVGDRIGILGQICGLFSKLEKKGMDFFFNTE